MEAVDFNTQWLKGSELQRLSDIRLDNTHGHGSARPAGDQ